MRIGIYQFQPVFGDTGYNLEKIEKRLKTGGFDLVVLPELCTTGYQFVNREEAFSLCEPVPDGPAVRSWTECCRKAGCFLVAGLGEREGYVCYNSAVLVGPEGWIGTYRKTHLFYEEKKWFAPGNSGFRVWDAGPARLGLMICFDWRFPEAARSLALQGADIICHPANLVQPFCQDAMVTRCIENRVFAVTANRTGEEKRSGGRGFVFTGGSQIVTPAGERLFRMGDAEEALRVVEVNPADARNKMVTETNDLFRDRRPEWYTMNIKE
jgi:predicted amidohydrolase